MKKISCTLFGIMVMMAINSCNNNLPEGVVCGPDGEIIEGNMEFTMSEFIADVDSKEWVESGRYERKDDGTIANEDYFYGWDGNGPFMYRFANDELQYFYKMQVYVMTGAPLNGEKLTSSSTDLKHYYNVRDYNVADVSNMMIFPDNEPWTIVTYNSECVVIDYTHLFKKGTDEEYGVDLRLILKRTEFPEYMESAGAYPIDYKADQIEYFEKYGEYFGHYSNRLLE